MEKKKRKGETEKKKMTQVLLSAKGLKEESSNQQK